MVSLDSQLGFSLLRWTTLVSRFKKEEQKVLQLNLNYSCSIFHFTDVHPDSNCFLYVPDGLNMHPQMTRVLRTQAPASICEYIGESTVR